MHIVDRVTIQLPGLLLVVVGLCLFGGCGSGEDFQKISGTVTLDNEPLKKGVVTLFQTGQGQLSAERSSTANFFWPVIAVQLQASIASK